MRTWAFGKHKRNGAVVTATILALVGAQPGLAQSAPDAASYGPNSRDGDTSTPIKHVIIIIGENRTFDNVFATYVPKSGNTVWNLLSRGDRQVRRHARPELFNALQYSGSDYDSFQLAPPKTPYTTLPPFQAGGPYTPYGCQLIGYASGSVTDCNTPANVAKVDAFRERPRA